MLKSKVGSYGEVDSGSAGGAWHRVSRVAKSVLSPIRKRFIGSAKVSRAEGASLVPLPKAGVAPEGLRLPAEVWFYL